MPELTRGMGLAGLKLKILMVTCSVALYIHNLAELSALIMLLSTFFLSEMILTHWAVTIIVSASTFVSK